MPLDPIPYRCAPYIRLYPFTAYLRCSHVAVTRLLRCLPVYYPYQRDAFAPVCCAHTPRTLLDRTSRVTCLPRLLVQLPRVHYMILVALLISTCQHTFRLANTHVTVFMPAAFAATGCYTCRSAPVIRHTSSVVHYLRYSCWSLFWCRCLCCDSWLRSVVPVAATTLFTFGLRVWVPVPCTRSFADSATLSGYAHLRLLIRCGFAIPTRCRYDIALLFVIRPCR